MYLDQIFAWPLTTLSITDTYLRMEIYRERASIKVKVRDSFEGQTGAFLNHAY
jgi:hypothetical protein